MPQVDYSPRARQDICSITAHIAADNPAAARRVLDAIEYTVAMLKQFPGLGAAYAHPSHPDLKAKLVSGFRNYIIFYTAIEDRIFIVRILHGSRDIPHVLDE